MSVPIASGYAANDYEIPARATDWLLGITPLRLAALGAVSVLVAARPAYYCCGPDQPFIKFVMEWLSTSAVILVAALPMFVLVIKVEAWTARWPARIRVPLLLAALVLGAVAFAALTHVHRIAMGRASIDPAMWIRHLAAFVRAFATGGLLTTILVFAARERETQRILHRARMARVQLGRQMTEARLKLLQAQIEPHFLFNCLASVKRLYENEPGRARELLAHLREYMRAAAAHGRSAGVTLGEEVELARSLLAIFKVRMGRRLGVTINLPAELRSAQVPPLMLGTLVENAIKHGVGPRDAGGSITITARRSADHLEIDVSDDGVGFRSGSGMGVGLANTCARLEALFGKSGELNLASNPAGGVTASLRLPLRFR